MDFSWKRSDRAYVPDQFSINRWWFSYSKHSKTLLVSTSRSQPGRAPRRLDFWSFRNLGALWHHFCVFFDHWKHFGSARGPLVMYESGLGHQRCPRRRHPRKRCHFLGPILESCFEHFFGFVGVCVQAQFLVELQGPAFFWYPFLTFVYTSSHSGASFLLQPF